MTEYKTVHDLASDGAWEEIPGVVGFRVKGGRVVWESASYSERGRGYMVRVQRLIPRVSSEQIGVGEAWFAPDTQITIVKESK